LFQGILFLLFCLFFLSILLGCFSCFLLSLLLELSVFLQCRQIGSRHLHLVFSASFALGVDLSIFSLIFSAFLIELFHPGGMLLEPGTISSFFLRYFEWLLNRGTAELQVQIQVKRTSGGPQSIKQLVCTRQEHKKQQCHHRQCG